MTMAECDASLAADPIRRSHDSQHYNTTVLFDCRILPILTPDSNFFQDIILAKWVWHILNCYAIFCISMISITITKNIANVEMLAIIIFIIYFIKFINYCYSLNYYT